MLPAKELEILDDAFGKCDQLIQKSHHEKLTIEEASEVLATMLFEITHSSSQKLIEVRDYDTIKLKGTFKYSGQANTMFKEGLMPKDVYEELKSVPGMEEDTRHIGPSYLRVKGLLTHQPTRSFFGKQMALLIRDYLREKPLSKSEGFIVCIPNMTGGVWIGDETRRHLETILEYPQAIKGQLIEYKVWPATPYARKTRKPIDVISPGEKLVDYIEGLVPSPQNTSAILCSEELRTTGETTQNATKTYRGFEYTDENDVRIIETCVFDYGHPVCVERLKRLQVDGLYLVGGKEFFGVSNKLGFISNSEYQTVIDWLTDPWKFTRRVLPDIKSIAEKQMA